MRGYFRRFLTAKQQHEREEIAQTRAKQLAKLRELVQVGGHEAESDYVQALKDWKPEITKEELKEKIRQFHDAVNERQSRDLG